MEIDLIIPKKFLHKSRIVIVRQNENPDDSLRMLFQLTFY